MRDVETREEDSRRPGIPAHKKIPESQNLHGIFVASCTGKQLAYLRSTRGTCVPVGRTVVSLTKAVCVPCETGHRRCRMCNGHFGLHNPPVEQPLTHGRIVPIGSPRQGLRAGRKSELRRSNGAFGGDPRITRRIKRLKNAHAAPLASARQRQENQKENQAGHSSKRTVEPRGPWWRPTRKGSDGGREEARHVHASEQASAPAQLRWRRETRKHTFPCPMSRSPGRRCGSSVGSYEAGDSPKDRKPIVQFIIIIAESPRNQRGNSRFFLAVREK